MHPAEQLDEVAYLKICTPPHAGSLYTPLLAPLLRVRSTNPLRLSVLKVRWQRGQCKEALAELHISIIVISSGQTCRFGWSSITFEVLLKKLHRILLSNSAK